MFLTTEITVKRQFLFPAFMGIGDLIVVTSIFSQIVKRSNYEAALTIRDLVLPLIWGVASFAYIQTTLYLVGLTK